MQKVYTEAFTLRTRDVDFMERWRADAILTAMQEVGTTQAELLGFGRDALLAHNLVFVLVRTLLEMKEYPHLNDTVLLKTWPGTSNRFFCPRHHTFHRPDGTPLGAAHTLWSLIDVSTRRVVSPLKSAIVFPDTSDMSPPCSVPAKVVQLVAPALECAYKPLYSDLDLNGHVNNTRYVTWLCDQLGSDALKENTIGRLLINYNKEILPATPLQLSTRTQDKNFSFLVQSDGVCHSEIEGSFL